MVLFLTFIYVKLNNNIFLCYNLLEVNMKRKKKLDIIYEDKEILVVNKPSGILTVSTPKEKEKTLFHEVSDYVKKSNPKAKVFIIHRLDKDTSGIVMFAKNQNIKYMYQNAWDKIVLKRGYVAVVNGKLNNKQDTIKSYLKETKTLFVYSSNKKDGKLAITSYKVLKENKKYSMLDIEIKTGRKNQIRVHMKDINHPILGDKKYGIKDNVKRLMLHANELILINPKTKKKMEFICNVPSIFENLFKEEKR